MIENSETHNITLLVLLVSVLGLIALIGIGIVSAIIHAKNKNAPKDFNKDNDSH
jgi:hypothetical protein